MIDIDSETRSRLTQNALYKEFEEESRKLIRRNAENRREEKRQKKEKRLETLNTIAGYTFWVVLGLFVLLALAAFVGWMRPTELSSIDVPASDCIQYIGEGSTPNMLECKYTTRDLETCIVFRSTASWDGAYIKCDS